MLKYGFALYCIMHNKLELLYEWDYYMYLFSVIIFNKQELLLISAIFCLIHSITINYFCLFGSYKLFQQQYDSLLYLDHINVQHQFTLYDCLFKIKSLKIIKNKIFKLSKYACISFNPFMTREDYIKLLRVYKLIELSFTFSILTSVFFVLIFLSFLINYFSRKMQVPLFSLMALFGYVDVIIIWLITPCIGIFLPWFLLHLLYGFITCIYLPLNRFSVRFAEIVKKSRSKCPIKKFKDLLRNLELGEKFFLHS